MNNSVYGKTMENVRNRISVTLIRANEEEQRLQRKINKPSYVRSIVFDNDLVSVESSREKVTLTKPVYVGTAILDLSKYLMYEFYYFKLKPRYEDNVNLLYTDTDSFVLDLHTEDVYVDMADMSDDYDTSNYPPDHPLYSTVNHKVVGKFKDEMGGVPIKEFIALR